MESENLKKQISELIYQITEADTLYTIYIFISHYIQKKD